MSLSIRDFNGIDLTANPPADLVVRALDDNGFPYRLQARVVEDNLDLPVRDVAASVDWNDGTLPQYFDHTASSAGTLSINQPHALSIGQHVVRLAAQNYSAPSPDFAGVNFTVTVVPRVVEAPPSRVVFGPILPKDQGFPNAQQWNFDSGTDLEILSSSIKMLLITAKGERVMEPEYGTNLRTLLFEPITNGLDQMAQQEIVEALNRWEPRVSLDGLSLAVDPNHRQVTLEATFVSKLTNRNFVVSNVYTP